MPLSKWFTISLFTFGFFIVVGEKEQQKKMVNVHVRGTTRCSGRRR